LPRLGEAAPGGAFVSWIRRPLAAPRPLSHAPAYAPAPCPPAPSPEEAVVFLVQEVARLSRAVAGMSEQVSRLATKVERPDLVKHSVEEAAERLGRSRSSVY